MRPRPELDGLDRNPQTVVLQELDEASSPGFDFFRPTEHDIQAALLTQARRQLEQVEAALRRLAANSYGYCIVCGHAINPERLSPLPYVLTCINCQQ